MSDLIEAITGLNEYQLAASRTAIYPAQGTIGGLLYAVLGIAGEAGEVANKTKKRLRDGVETITDETLADELGDVLWYAAAIANELGISLSEVATANIAKLDARLDAGTLRGSGDAR